MKKILLFKTIVIFTILMLITLGFSPVATSYKIDGQSKIQTDETTTYSQNEKEIETFKNYLEKILQLEETSDITIDEIINIIQNMVIDNPTLLRKTIVISQGWARDINIFSNSKLKIMRDLFHFWHYTQASKSGVESKTIVMRASDIITSRSVELYRGTQLGFMFRPFGIYLYQKRTVPQLSHTLFIGFSSNIYITAQEIIQIPIPLP
jgi:hypothetical protein